MHKTIFWRLALPIVLALLGLGLFLHSAQAASREIPIQLQTQENSPTNVITVTTTVQAAINSANNGDIVFIPVGTYTESLTVDKNITLRGVNSHQTELVAPSGQRVVTVPNAHNVRLEGLAVAGGNPSNTVEFGPVGGGVYASGNLQMVNCWIGFNQAEYGGGVYQDDPDGRVDVTGGYIVDNYSNQDGGGFYVSGSIVLTDTEVRGNVASRHGGGLHVQNGTTKMVRGAVDYNYSEGNGGGLNANNSVTVLDTLFFTNTARQDGGGLLEWSSGVAVELSDSYFLQNRSYGNGGAVWTTGNLTITNTMVVSNTADAGKATVTSGGGVYLSNGSLSVTTSNFRGNIANCATCDSLGGGLYIDTAGPAVIRDSLLEKNYAPLGGGVYGLTQGLIIQKSTFKRNDAGYGGAVNAFGVDIQGTDFISNTCDNSGGALVSGGTINISGSRFLNNTAGFSGGAIWGPMNLTVLNSLFAGNHASNSASVMELQGNKARTLEHVTIASVSLDSQPAIDLPDGTLGITNTIITNFNMGIAMAGGTLNADYNLFYGNPQNVVSIGGTLHWGIHNLSGNPLFINPAINDYHLQAGSPAIDKGKNLGIVTDLDRKPRDARPDIGTYEFWGRIYLPAVRK